MYVPLLVAQFVHMISNDGGEVDINKNDYIYKNDSIESNETASVYYSYSLSLPY